MSAKAYFSSLLTLLPMVAFADPGAIQVPNELRSRPDVQALIAEYNRIAAANPICNERQNFGLRTFKVDGELTVRFYVDGKGIGCIPRRMRPQEIWEVTRRSWTETDWRDYQAFVQNLGMAVEQGKCSTVDTCLISSSNTLRTATDKQAFHYADCADFPYYLRGYFSFRRGLPFSYANRLRARPLVGDEAARIAKVDRRVMELRKKKQSVGLSAAEELELEARNKQRRLFYDPRYSRNGNWVAGRAWVLPGSNTSFFSWMSEARNYLSTASLRVWQNQGETATDADGNTLVETEPDFYSPALNTTGIFPGTVIYKHDGHTAVVYRIDRDNPDPSQAGKIYYFDAHPDNTISWGVVDETWTRNMGGRPTLGGGFKNFRPITYNGGVPKAVSSILPDKLPFGIPLPKVSLPSFSGEKRIRMAFDHELENGYFSDEQYRLFEDPSAKVMINEFGLKAKVDYLDFLRLRMSNGRYRINPASIFRDDLRRICTNMKYRREAVEEATDKGFHLLPHPERLPDNIYAAGGEWEKYSTPGRGVGFKQRVINLNRSLGKYREMIAARHPLMKAGLTLDSMKSELLATWREVSDECTISYRRSNGAEESFSLAEAVRRAPYMSFDPYLCPERRFGATSASELATCTDTPDKAEWHMYMQFLRNTAEKTSNDPMGWSLPELKVLNKSKVDPSLVEKLDVERAIRAL